MEEVARFLERCYQNIETITKNSQLARSRSVNHMYVDHSQPQPNQPSSSTSVQHINGNAGNESNRNYHRNSTNSFDKSQHNSSATTMTMAAVTQQLNESFTSTSTANTTNSNDAYNAFTDFTWWVWWHSEKWQIESNYNFEAMNAGRRATSNTMCSHNAFQRDVFVSSFVARRILGDQWKMKLTISSACGMPRQ